MFMTTELVHIDCLLSTEVTAAVDVSSFEVSLVQFKCIPQYIDVLEFLHAHHFTNEVNGMTIVFLLRLDTCF